MNQHTKQQKKADFDIYNYPKRIAATKKLIKNDSRISAADEVLIENYDKKMIQDSIANATRNKQLQVLLNLSRMLPVNWAEVNKTHIDNLVTEIVETYSSNGQETHSSKDHKKVLRIFFRWYKLGSRDKEAGNPPETAKIKIKNPPDTISREELIDQKDLDRLLYACAGDLQAKAFIHFHYESGDRPGETLTLKIKHVKFDEHGAVVQIDGKTVAHPKRIVKSVPDLAAWMNAHPTKDNHESPLWISTFTNSYGKPLTADQARYMLKKYCKKANLEKRVWLNLFRHSEATLTATFMTEPEMRKRHGWSKNSTMPAKYVHLINQDVDDKILSYYGIKKEKNKEDIKLPIKCVICEFRNAPNCKLCSKCGRALSLEGALVEDEKKDVEVKKQNNLIEELTKKMTDQENRINKMEEERYQLINSLPTAKN